LEINKNAPNTEGGNFDFVEITPLSILGIFDAFERKNLKIQEKA
jgi:hypothetical protein